VLISPLYENSLDFNNAYFSVGTKIFGRPGQHLGGLCPRLQCRTALVTDVGLVGMKRGADTVCIFSEEADSVSLLVFISKVYTFRIKVCVAVLGLDVLGQR